MSADPAPEPAPTPSLRSLPAEVRSTLVRGLGAYLRSMPRARLPATLRRFAGFRQQALSRHAPDLLEALSQPELWPGVLEWLDEDDHNLSATDASTLRAVCERKEGWFEELSSAPSAPRPSHPRETGVPRSVLERERARAARARDDARRAREEARRSVRAERAKSGELAEALRGVRAELTEARRARDAAQAAIRRATEEAQREVRRARRERDRARESRESLRTELKQERRKVTSLQREVAALGDELQLLNRRAPATRRTPRSSARRRRPLQTPPGRLPEAVDTLDEWLAQDDVRLVVDGYNVTKAPGGFGDLDLERQRQRLIDELERLARRRKAEVTIVFDGSSLAPGVARRHRGVVDVQYSGPTEIADDHLVAVLRGLPPDAVVVVTDDRDLQERVKALGATVAGSGQLLGLIR
jgi:predicted RNA-binding protein with PIN domain